MSVDCQLLIDQVYKRPGLWNRLSPEYYNKPLLHRQWLEITAQHPGCSVATVKNRWKNLRDTFRIEMRKDSSRWTFYRSMLFIKGQFKPRFPTADNGEEFKPLSALDITENGHVLGINVTEDMKPMACLEMAAEQSRYNEDTDDDDGTQDRMNLEDVDLRQGLGLGVTRRSDEEEEDYHFLMSFLPEMKKLDPKKKMLMRVKMTQLFYKEVYGD